MQIAERKINEKTNSAVVKRWCIINHPATSNGAKHCLAALTSIRNKKKFTKARIVKLARTVWVKEHFSTHDERLFIKKYGTILRQQDHINRLNYFLSSRRKLSRAAFNKLDKEHQKLFKLKLHLSTKHRHLSVKKHNNIFNRISTNLRKEPHLLYLRAQWYRTRKDHKHFVAMLMKYSNVKAIKTDQWFKLRTLLVWDLVDAKKYRTAYKIAASHRYRNPANYVDGEWLAGKVAYFHLKNPNLAYKHFANILKNSKYSLSRAKGAYWSGVTMKAMKNSNQATKHFKIASKYVDTFYGQLALMQLHNNRVAYYSLPKVPKVTKGDVQWFKNNELLIVSHILSRARKDYPARKFIRVVLDMADTKGKKYLVTKFGSRVGMDSLSTISGKEAARRGALFIEHAYPTLKLKKKRMSVETALVHSIIRQESEFNPVAKSSAGATGLMQLMYPTAKRVGRTMKRNVTSHSLKNPKINILLGTKYLSQLVKKYNGSYVLAIAAYNAGEGNVKKWINKKGDPRKLKRLDRVIAWIESIPFSETRGYVQYVLSNLQIYRNILNNTEGGLQKLRINLKRDLLL